MKMNVITVELVSEVHNLCTYKVTYQEQDTYVVKVVGNTTFNYKESEIENIPESVLGFVEKWIMEV